MKVDKIDGLLAGVSFFCGRANEIANYGAEYLEVKSGFKKEEMEPYFSKESDVVSIKKQENLLRTLKELCGKWVFDDIFDRKIAMLDDSDLIKDCFVEELEEIIEDTKLLPDLNFYKGVFNGGRYGYEAEVLIVTGDVEPYVLFFGHVD